MHFEVCAKMYFVAVHTLSQSRAVGIDTPVIPNLLEVDQYQVDGMFNIVY